MKIFVGFAALASVAFADSKSCLPLLVHEIGLSIIHRAYSGALNPTSFLPIRFV